MKERTRERLSHHQTQRREIRVRKERRVRPDGSEKERQIARDREDW